MEQSPSWENNRSLTSQERLRILWNPKVHYRIHKCSPPLSIQKQSNPVHVFPSHLLEIHFNNIILSMVKYSNKLPSIRSPHQYPIRTSPVSYTCHMPRPSHFSWFDRSNNIWWGAQSMKLIFNPLTPNDDYSCRTAPLTSKCYILYIYSTNKGAEYFKHGI